MSKGLHRFAVLVACATFFLIIAGANVTSHDAGLATSDWPLSNGSLFPKMVGNLFWEHGHRMIATVVGMLTIVLAIYIQARDPRGWVKRLGWAALGCVIAQGLLGGLTVKLNLPLAVSAAHATLAQLFFLITISLDIFTSRVWREQGSRIAEDGGPSIRSLGVVALVAILAQLVLGATLRHSATWDRDLPTRLLLAHLGGALIVTLVLGFTIMSVLLRYRARRIWQTGNAGRGAFVCAAGPGLAAYVTRVSGRHMIPTADPDGGNYGGLLRLRRAGVATTIVLTCARSECCGPTLRNTLAAA